MRDFKTAVVKKVNATAAKTQSKAELITLLTSIGIVHTDYIASLPVYRFSVDEVHKVELKLAEAEIQLAEYDRLISSDDARRSIYITELKHILKQYNQGKYVDTASS